MSENKLLRRTSLTAGSVLAALYFPAVWTLESLDYVNIQDYNPKNWVASSRQVFPEGQMVVIPKGPECKDLDTAVVIPPGKTLRPWGRISDSGRGRFVLQDGCKVIGDQDGSLRNIILGVHGPDCVIKRITMSGFGPVTRIYTGGKTLRLMCNLVIGDIIIARANYGVLRQGFHNRMGDVKITSYRFSGLQGDAIEWNVAVNDSNILVSGHVIERTSCTNDNVSWDIGIGPASNTYDNSCSDKLTIKNFVMTNITGTDYRQLVHVENGKHSIICNIATRNITPDFSRKTGIDNAAVAIHGCDNFATNNINMGSSTGTLIGYGVIKGRYLSIPQNFKLNDTHLDNTRFEYKLRGTQISSSNTVSFMAITDVEMKRVTFELYN